jgi:hypothetical protein
MVRCGQYVPGSRTVAPQPVGDYSKRLSPVGLQDLGEAPLRGLGVPSALHKDLQDVTVLVDRPPQILEFSANRNEDLIDVPDITQPPFSSLQPSAVVCSELPAPAPNRFIGDVDPPRSASRSSTSRKLRLNRW